MGWINLSPYALRIYLQIGGSCHLGNRLSALLSFIPTSTWVSHLPGSPLCLRPSLALIWTNSSAFVYRSGCRQNMETTLSISNRGSLVQGIGDTDVCLLRNKGGFVRQQRDKQGSCYIPWRDSPERGGREDAVLPWSQAPLMGLDPESESWSQAVPQRQGLEQWPGEDAVLLGLLPKGSP